MAKRVSNVEQNEHDLVVGKSADTYRLQGGVAYTNPGSDKNHEIDGLYPDVVAKKSDGTIVIEEIETETTVTEDECENQWKPYSELGHEFNLVVPVNKASLAQRFIRRSQLSVTLQTYAIRGSDVTFYDSRGIRIGIL
jgi:hypothetical protein